MWSCSSSTPSALGVAPSWKPICHGYAESHSSGDRNDGVISCSIYMCCIAPPPSLYSKGLDCPAQARASVNKVKSRWDMEDCAYELIPHALVTSE